MTITIKQQNTPVTVNDIRGRGTVTVEIAARFLGVSVRHYYYGVKDGSLPGLRLGRRVLVPAATLLKFVDVDETSA